MILTCPACSTRYMVDPAAIGPNGRTVKCAKCGHQWVQPAAPDTARKAALTATRPSSVAASRGTAKNLPGFPVPRQPRYATAAGWASLGVVIVALGASLWLGQAQLVAAWPATARLYSAVGVEIAPVPAGTGLEVRDLIPRRTVQDGTPLLLLEGEVVNITDEPVPVPPIMATLRDHDDNIIQQWTFDVGLKALAPLERIPFQTQFENPSNAATDIKIFFTDFNQSK